MRRIGGAASPGGFPSPPGVGAADADAVGLGLGGGGVLAGEGGKVDAERGEAGEGRGVEHRRHLRAAAGPPHRLIFLCG